LPDQVGRPKPPSPITTPPQTTLPAARSIAMRSSPASPVA